MRSRQFLIAISIVVLGALNCQGDVVSATVFGYVLAEVENEIPESENSPGTSDSLSVSVLGNGTTTDSQTNSSANWNWSANTLSGSGTVNQAKTTLDQTGGFHAGESLFELSFTIDSAMEYDLAGTYELDGATNSDDFAGWLLQGGPTSIANDGTLLAATIGSVGFADSGELAAGSYTFTMTVELNETLNTIDSRAANFTLNHFTLTNSSAVPEPGTVAVLLGGIFLLGVRRRR